MHFIWKQGPRVWRKSGEAQNPCCLKSRVKFPQSVMIWGAMSSAGVGPLCFLKSTVNTAIYQEILEHFHASFCWQALWRWLISFSSRTWHLPTRQRYQKLVQWPGVTVLDWPANSAWPEPHRESMGVLSRGRWETPDPTMQMSWRPLSKKPGLPYHLSSATNWSPHATRPTTH